MKPFFVYSWVAGLLAVLITSTVLTGCATGQIDLPRSPGAGVAKITGERKFIYLGLYIYRHECGIIQVDSTSVDELIGAKTATVPEGVHRLFVNCHVQPMSGQRTIEGELSFFAQAGHEYTVGPKGDCIVAIDNANKAIVKSDCEPSTGR